jgi:hypothetical protein
MHGSCPRCRTAVEIPASGAYTCSRCRTGFQVYLTAPPAREAVLPEQAADGDGSARCALHAANRAGEVCERCGDFMCVLCTTPFEGRRYCPRCFDLLWDRGAMEVTQSAFTTPRSALRTAAAAALLFWAWILALPVALAAIVLGILALRQIARQPDLRGRSTAVAALLIASAALVGSLLFLVFLFYGRR